MNERGMTINNILYPRTGAREDEIRRLDGVLLQAGRCVIGRVPYELVAIGVPEYETWHDCDNCVSVTYRWLMLTPEKIVIDRSSMAPK